MSSHKNGERSLTYAEAIYEATYQEMERDEGVFVFGLGVDDPKGMYGTTLDLHDVFGCDRNFDTPLSEDAMTGVAIGAALAGMRPIHVHQRMDFMLLCMNQLVNIAAKTSYMFSGACRVPIVIRCIVGRSWGQGAQHSQALHSYFAHIPGIKVAAPTTPHDAKGCLTAAVRDNNPVILMEHRMLYEHIGVVPKIAYETPFGKARILTVGDDITLVGISHMVVECLRAKHLLKDVGISAEVIDPITLTPIDSETITGSVAKTGRLLVIDNAWVNCGISAEIIAQLSENTKGSVNFMAKRMGFLPTPCPTTKPLENHFYPNAGTIAKQAFEMVFGRTSDWQPKVEEASEIREFKGPF